MKPVLTSVAVGRRARHHGHAGIAAGAGNVLGHDLLAEALRQFLRDDARDHVGRAAGRERHDQADGLCRIALGRRVAGRAEHRQNERGRRGEGTEHHGILP